ncbi:DNA repair protein rad18 [Aulographum hederae CBS 113979]|uniref:Postreplication repair E3 ubiquitin-protein ligase RAD18 n=1 Tax=Aulographum hederae CBS 113979 TaxID=1176131 RepID=A0A6G1HD03_9PEZI|nr:DNA repair protein rad18 [Aulographum hederae CBS 113979]
MDSNLDLADSTDWLNTSLPAFAALDSALRCQVCKDFYDTPMITSCSHTFCSLCIRQCLSAEGKCPACRASDQTSKLRINTTVQDLVEAFKVARPTALELARRGSFVDVDAQAGQRGGRKRKADNSILDEDEEEAHSQRRKTRRSTRGVSSQTMPSQEVIYVDDEEDGGDASYQPEDGLVSCPICQSRMKEAAVFNHVENCDGTPASSRQRESRSGSATQPSQPKSLIFSRPSRPSTRSSSQQHIPQLNYSMLRENALRKKLSELSIPASGNHQQMARRHTEWANLYNANCDSSHPRNRTELLRDLNAWERAQGQAHTSKMGGVMAKDFDSAGWSERNKLQFSDLIAEAKKKRLEKLGTADESKKDDGEKADDQQEIGDVEYKSHDIEASKDPPMDVETIGSLLPSSTPTQDGSQTTALPPQIIPIEGTNESTTPAGSPFRPSSKLSPARKPPMFTVTERTMGNTQPEVP